MQCLGPTLWNALVAADSPAGLGRRLSLVGVGQLRRWIWSATHGAAGSASGPEGERGLPRGPGPALLRALVGSCRRAIGVGTAEQPAPYDHIGRDRDQVKQEAIKYSIGVPFADLT